MGEIAEMMLDGTLDCETGEYLSEGPGYPRTAESFSKNPYQYAYDDGSSRKRKSRKPKVRMGKSTKRLFCEIYMKRHHGPFLPEKEQMPQIHSLIDRHILKARQKGGGYEFTNFGKEKGAELFAVGEK